MTMFLFFSGTVATTVLLKVSILLIFVPYSFFLLFVLF